MNSAVSNSPPVLNNPDTIYSRLPEHNQSYGTISTSSSMKATNGQLGERHISRTDSVNPNPGQPTFPELKMVNGDSRIDRKASDSSMESIAEQKAEEVASKEESRGLRFLVMLFTWIRYLWKWLFGRPKRAEQ